MLALLLARRGVPVTLLEAHADFEREFRGDTLHPIILEVLDQIGLADRLHALPHVKWFGPSLVTDDGLVTLADFRRLRTKFPYIMLVPQERFLEVLAAEAARYPNFTLTMRARVDALIEEDGAVRGVRYRDATGAMQEIRADLTIGADGRFSKVRQLAGFEPVPLSDPMELLWFRLPRRAEDASLFDLDTAAGAARPFAIMRGERGRPAVLVHRGDGFILGVIDRVDHWQVAYIFQSGSYQELKAAGITALTQSIAARVPRLSPHLAALTDWRQLSPLSVAFSRCARWYKPGLLLIGDAAHVMTPAAGAGIKYAIEDAVEAANLLARPLLEKRVDVELLAKVQRRREWPTRMIQTIAAFNQANVLMPALAPGAARDGGAPRLPLLARLFLNTPGLRNLPARFIAVGIRRVRVEE